MSFKGIKLWVSQLDSLGVENTSELLCRQVAFTEDVVVLVELNESDTVFLDDVLNLPHKLVFGQFTSEISVFLNISRLSASSRGIDDIFEYI